MSPRRLIGIMGAIRERDAYTRAIIAAGIGGSPELVDAELKTLPAQVFWQALYRRGKKGHPCATVPTP